jgi:hypothetical protein
MSENRWDYSKSKSNYHFDSTLNEDAKPPFKILGHIKEDLGAELERLMKVESMHANTFSNRIQVQGKKDKQAFTVDMDLEELRLRGLPEDFAFFYNISIDKSEIFKKVAESFGFKYWKSSVHIQKPGQSFPYHIDELPGIKDNEREHWLDTDPDAAARFEIQIYNWVPGHVWAYGNTYWKQWTAGEIVYHEWRNIPHGTANISREIRATLQITGFVSDITRKIIAEGY